MVQDPAGDAGRPDEHGELTRVSVRHGEGESVLGIGFLIEPQASRRASASAAAAPACSKGRVEANGVSKVGGAPAPLACDVVVGVHLESSEVDHLEKRGGDCTRACTSAARRGM